MGLGKGRGHCTLQGLWARNADGAWSQIYDGQTRTLKAGDCTLRPHWPTTQVSALSVRFLTPARLKHQGHLTDHIDFRLMVFHLLKRACELTYFYCPGVTVDWDFGQALNLASQVHTHRHLLRWMDWERWSNRQQTRMKLGGLVGEVTFSGHLGPFVPLLRLGEVMHIGKGTSFGLGKYLLHQAGDCPNRRTQRDQGVHAHGRHLPE